MANTADILGEQEALDGLVAHTLEDFEDGRITKIRSYAFYNNHKLKTLNLSNVTLVNFYAFGNCCNIESVEIPKTTAIYGNVFYKCYKLKTININGLKGFYGSGIFDRCYSLNSIDLSKLNNSSLPYRCLGDIGVGTIATPAILNGNFAESVRLSTIDILSKQSITSYAMANCYSLVHLILRNEQQSSLNDLNTFDNTPIKNGIGWIYVPSSLVESYKTASNWSTYANQIVSLDEYPKALSGETIRDSWDEIFQSESDGSYKTKYSVGDTKYLVIGGTYVLMQIIAFDKDILSSDHTSTAKITWLAKSLSFKFPMNFENDTTGGWADCECRKFLNDTIYKQIPENVRNKIVAVDKTYTVTSSLSSTPTVSDKLWIPSVREIYGDSSYENDGIDYTDFFTGSSVMKRYNGLSNNVGYYWWLRSVSSSACFRFVYTTGGAGNDFAYSDYGLVLGFCT